MKDQDLAERQGFEPWEDGSPHLISSQARSAAPAPLPSISVYTAKRGNCYLHSRRWLKEKMPSRTRV